MVHLKTWALVSNGLHARILRGVEEGNTQEPVELASKSRSPHLRDIMSDKPGRSFSSGAVGQRSAMEPGSDPIHHDMEEFARETIAVLERHRRAGDFRALAILASPQMLGVLRKEIPDALAGMVILERATNLMNLPEAELRSTVRDIVKEESLK